MKLKSLIVAASLAFTAPQAWAQTSAGADAGSTSNAQLQLSSRTNATVYTDNSTTEYGDAGDGVADGTIRQRVENVPNLVPPDFGSGHPCALGTSAGLVIVGGGLTGGSSRVDEACMMVRSSNPQVQQAGWALYAARDKQACIALRSTGVIDPSSSCGEKQRRPSPPSVQPAKVALAVDCRREGNTITPVVTRAVSEAYTVEQIKAACM